jgi:hypothetical protein
MVYIKHGSGMRLSHTPTKCVVPDEVRCLSGKDGEALLESASPTCFVRETEIISAHYLKHSIRHLCEDGWLSLESTTAK